MHRTAPHNKELSGPKWQYVVPKVANADVQGKVTDSILQMRKLRLEELKGPGKGPISSPKSQVSMGTCSWRYLVQLAMDGRQWRCKRTRRGDSTCQ